MKHLLPTATRLWLAAFIIVALAAHAAPRSAKPAPPVVMAPALSGDYLMPDFVSNAKLNAKGTYYTIILRRSTAGMTQAQVAAELASWQGRKGKVVRFP